MLIFDTSGIDLYVTENNSETLNSFIHILKPYYNNTPKIDTYIMVYAIMRSNAASSPQAKQQYTISHFCYADMFDIFTNVHGII